MKVAIIGAGLAGLTCAYQLSKKDLWREGTPPEISVFEAEDRIGGKLRTVPFACGPTDMGAEAYLAIRKDATDFFEELGLGDKIVYPSTRGSRIYAEGQLHDLPRRTIMGIPLDADAARGIVTDPEALEKLEQEADAEGIDWTPGEDRSLGELVAQRFGRQVADRLVSALLGGVYSCLADDLGIRATVPNVAEALDALAEAGEKVTLSAAVRKVKDARPAPTASPKDPRPVFASFEGGYADMYEALAEASGAQIFIDAFITGIARTSTGGFTLDGPGAPKGEVFDAVVVAVPAPTAALLLRDVAPQASAPLKTVELASSVVVGMKFASAENLPDASGILIAADEPGMHAKAFTFSSKKWPHLEKRGGALVRASFGRYGDDALVRAEEEELVELALDDLEKVTRSENGPGFDGRAAGLEEIFVQRWYGGLPRYSEKHLATLAQVREGLAQEPLVAAIGAWAGGVGVPAVIANATAAAESIAAQLDKDTQ